MPLIAAHWPALNIGNAAAGLAGAVAIPAPPKTAIPAPPRVAIPAPITAVAAPPGKRWYGFEKRHRGVADLLDLFCTFYSIHVLVFYIFVAKVVY